MHDTGTYIGRHDADLAHSTHAAPGKDEAVRHYQPRRLAAAEVDGRLAELSRTQHQPRHAA